MKSEKNRELIDYREEFVQEEEEKPIELPKQEEFFRMPKKFGTIPDVERAPLNWNSKKGYTNLFPKVRLPFQKIDTISFGNKELESNKLYWGDNLHIMRLLPSDSIDLIYIDPPFFSGRNYNVVFGDQNEVMTFEDIWDGGLPTYLTWLDARLVEMKRLLRPSGSIYVHLDWHAIHYIKTEMDKIFGYDNFRNEIIWHKKGGLKSVEKIFPRKYDGILLFTKSNEYTFHIQRKLAEDNALYDRWIKYSRDGKTVLYKDFPRTDKVKFTDYTKRFIAQNGRKPEADDVFYVFEGAIMDSVWEDIADIYRGQPERLGYPTQKPEALLERIINTSSNEGDVVADFFVGGGTTAAIAQKLGRRWVVSDISRIAIEITKGRILKLLKSETGTQTNLGRVANMEVWSWGFYDVDKLKESNDEEFEEFVVRAFGGRPIIGEKTISGIKNGLPILVGSNDPKKSINKNDVLQFAKYVNMNYELKKTGIILAWGFSEDAIKAKEALANLGSEVEFVKIKPFRIGSVEFINEVIENKEEYKKVFRFVFPPQVMLHIDKKDSGEYIFDFSDSVSLNNGKIINIQADFDFDGNFVPAKGYAFNLEELILKHRFDSVGKKKVAFKVEDDQGGEKLALRELSL